MSELMEQAKTEGISVDHPGNEGAMDGSQGMDAKVDSSPTTAKVETGKDQTGNAEKTAPVTQEAESQSSSAIRKTAFKEAGEWKRRYSELERSHREMNDMFKQLMERMSPKQSSGPQVSDEQRLALRQLAQLIKSDPEVLKELGLDRIPNLEQATQSYETSRLESAFNGEFDDVINYGVKTFGLEREELEQELVDYIDQHPLYSKANYAKGAVQAAFRDLYWDRMDELKERAANLKLIQEQKAKKNGNIESSKSQDSTNSDKTLEPDMGSFIKRRISESGGLIV